MEEIGREFSGRDHSTIVYSLKTMERDMKNEDVYKRQILYHEPPEKEI